MTEITELMPEAGGGGDRVRPPDTVITGDYPEDHYERMRRQLDKLKRECERLEMIQRIAEEMARRV